MQENTATAAADQNAIALLPPAERAVIVLNSSKAEVQLKELVAKSADIIEVKDKDGREQAHRAAMNLRNARTAITNAGKVARDDANAFSKAVIAEEKRLIAISQAEEDRVFALRDRYDAEQARIKAEAERAEAERKARIQGQIVAIRNIPVALAGGSADDMAAEIAELESFKAGEEFAEFHADADAAALTALATLRDMHKRQVAAEAEADRIAAERAALEAEKAERERVAAETKRQLEAQQAAIVEERRKAEAEMQAQREAFEAERRAFQEQQAAAARAEGERLDAERKAAEKLAADQAEANEIEARGHYYSTTTFRDDGKPIMCNPDGTRSIFCDVDEGDEAPAVVGVDLAGGSDMAVETTIEDGVVTELTASTTDDSLAVQGFTMMVAELYATRTADAIRELLDSVLMELEGKKVAA